MKKTSILTLLALLALLALEQTAWAQQVRDIDPKSLPYSYGFEDPDEFNCWTRVDCHDASAIYGSVAYEGNSSFRFRYNSNPPQYLISPKFEGTFGMYVSFYYKNSSDQYYETFQVGYSTIESPSPNDFTWGEEVTANDQSTWKLYKEFFPIGTKYVAVKLTSNDRFYLYLDNFNFEPALCADEDKCELTFVLTDRYSDGWNGNAIRVLDEETEFVLAEMTNVGDYNTETYTLAVCHGRQLRFEWVNGEWSDECSYTVTDINGTPVFSGEDAMSGPFSFTPDCTPIFIFDGDWNDGSNWNIGVVPQAGKDVIIQADAVIPAGYTANAWDVTIESGSILIKDGGQLKHSNEVQGTIQKFTQGFGSNDNRAGWYLL